MASGPEIVLMATGISFANEWWQSPSNEPNFRVLAAGGIFAGIDAAVGSLSPQMAKGLAVIMMITVLLTPFNGSSPVGTLSKLVVAQPNKKGKK